MTPESLRAFFDQPGINLRGVCRQAGITPQYLHRLFWEKKLPLKNKRAKLEAVMRRYGYKP